MTKKEIEEAKNKLDKLYQAIDVYLESKYRNADTLERIKIRGVQKNINKIVELEIRLEQESNR